MTGKRNLFLGLLIGLVLGGALPAFLSFHDWTSAQDSRTVLLRQGWNQLVWTADNQPADTALAAIAGDLVIAYGWRDDSQTFSRYVPGKQDASTMGEVEKDSGYWLLMTREVAFSFPTADGQQCPQPTPCLDSALAEAMQSGDCLGYKIETDVIDIVSLYESLVQFPAVTNNPEFASKVAESRRLFDEYCTAVPLAPGPSLALTHACTGAGQVQALLAGAVAMGFAGPAEVTALATMNYILNSYCTLSQ